MRYFSLLIILAIGCLSCSVSTAERAETAASAAPSGMLPPLSERAPFTTSASLQNTSRTSQNIYGNTFRINVGPQLVTVRAAYRDDGKQETSLGGGAAGVNPHGYFDLRATSALAGTSLVGEGEMAYSMRSSADKDTGPEMFRLGLKDRWQSFSYGADYKSVAKGFTPVAGTIAQQSREDALIWGERAFGSFKLRGSMGESWERAFDTADLRVTRTAATALQINQRGWAGSLSTSYGLVEQGSGLAEDSAVLINTLTTSFRPSAFLLLEPNFSIRDERNQSTGVRTQTPASGLLLSYSPLKTGFRLTGGTSFSRIFNTEGSNDISIHGASASVDWKLGKFLGREDSLSITFNYNRLVDHISRSNSYGGLSSMLQLKIAGF
jgi:hypothetical protein